jgi:uncharacterized membrane protein YkvA (DUF1232 family)
MKLPNSSILPLIDQFLIQAQTGSLKTSGFQKSYRGLDLKVSFGVGIAAKIPWIAFLKAPNKVSEGTYPVFLYYKEVNTLVLAYGVSDTTAVKHSWDFTEDQLSVSDWYINTFNKKPYRYGSSFYKSSYDLDAKFDGNKLQVDLNEIINEYHKLVFPQSILKDEKLEEANTEKNKVIVSGEAVIKHDGRYDESEGGIKEVIQGLEETNDSQFDKRPDGEIYQKALTNVQEGETKKFKINDEPPKSNKSSKFSISNIFSRVKKLVTVNNETAAKEHSEHITDGHGPYNTINKWTKAELNILKEEYPKTDTKVLAERLGRTLEAVRFQAKKYHINKTDRYMQSLYEAQKGKEKEPEVKRLVTVNDDTAVQEDDEHLADGQGSHNTINKWTDTELNILKEEYPKTDTKVLAGRLGRTLEAVRFQAKKHGLKKMESYMQSLYEVQRGGGNNAEINNHIKSILKIKLPVTLDKREKDLIGKAFLESIKHMEKEEFDFISSKIVRKIKSTSRARTTWISQMGSFYSVLFEACERHNNKNLLSDNAHDLVGAALLYFVNPFDIIPDHIVGKGYADDFYVLQLCLRKIKKNDADILNKLFEKTME